jgi:predicted O-methyltransferase YrrM
MPKFAVPSLLKRIPRDLDVCQRPPSSEELESFVAIRQRYVADIAKASAETDKIRAFRLLKGAKRYLEVGTFDKFNLRYIMTITDPLATIVDVDVEKNDHAEALLREDAPRGIQYHVITGDSTSASTQSAVASAAGMAGFNGVFIDGNHTAAYVMNDFAIYGELVSDSGYVLFHDVKWEGSESAKGVADALEVIQHHVPVYQILHDEPVTHWYRPQIRERENWGGMAIIRGEDFRRG